MTNGGPSLFLWRTCAIGHPGQKITSMVLHRKTGLTSLAVLYHRVDPPSSLRQLWVSRPWSWTKYGRFPPPIPFLDFKIEKRDWWGEPPVFGLSQFTLVLTVNIVPELLSVSSTWVFYCCWFLSLDYQLNKNYCWSSVSPQCGYHPITNTSLFSQLDCSPDACPRANSQFVYITIEWELTSFF